MKTLRKLTFIISTAVVFFATSTAATPGNKLQEGQIQIVEAKMQNQEYELKDSCKVTISFIGNFLTIVFHGGTCKELLADIVIEYRQQLKDKDRNQDQKE